jgi:hypothetical protein
VTWQCYQQLRSVYHAGPAKGRQIAQKVLDSFHSCPIPEVARLGRTLLAWRAQVLAYFDTRGVSNGGTEAVNLIIEKVRRLAHGFKDFDHYRLRILVAGTDRWDGSFVGISVIRANSGRLAIHLGSQAAQHGKGPHWNGTESECVVELVREEAMPTLSALSHRNQGRARLPTPRTDLCAAPGPSATRSPLSASAQNSSRSSSLTPAFFSAMRTRLAMKNPVAEHITPSHPRRPSASTILVTRRL